MPPRKPKISTSDRDILKPRPRHDSTAPVDDRPPPSGLIPDLGDTSESLAAFIKAVARALIDGDIDEKKADSLTAMHRTALSALKHRDQKQEDAELDEMIRRAEAVESAGLQREADDRRHVTRRSAEDATTADAEEGDGDE